LGYRVSALGTADDLMKILDIGSEQGEDEEDRAIAGGLLVQGWNMCIPCLADFAIRSCSKQEQARCAELLAELLDES
jgi:hypothetical protein